MTTDGPTDVPFAAPLPWPVAIVGCGYVGRALTGRLLDQAGAPDPAVLATTRSGAWAGPEPFPDRVRLRSWDNGVDDGPALALAIADAASIVVAWSSGGGEQDRRSVFLDGLERLDRALDDLAPRRIVYVSSTSALPNVDAWLDESCAARPLSERGQVQRDAEDRLRALAEARGIPWVILRSAGIYGPGRELARLYRRTPHRQLPGDGMTPTNLVHRDDLVTAIVAALALDEQRSALIHVCDDDHCTRREMVRSVAALDAGPPPRWESAAEPDAVPVGKRVANRALKTVLGVQLAHPTHLPHLPRDPADPADPPAQS